MMKNDKYLIEADKFYNKAVDEFNRAKLKKDDLLFRDAAEKAWNAIVKATNYIIKKINGVDVKSHHKRRESLFRIEQQNGKVRKYNFRIRFAASCHILHELCFYDGIYTEEELEVEIKEKVKKYINDAKKI